MTQLVQQVIHYLTHLFSTEGFPPRWHCGFWTPFHGWFYIIADLGIWSAYFTIPLLLAFFVRKRKDVPFTRVFMLFAAFILACGTTHLLDAMMFWWPAYRLSGMIYFWTAIISWWTIFTLIKVLPEALKLKTPAQLEEVVRQRTLELAEANRQVSEINARLQLYTSKLEESNRELEQFATVASHDLQAPLRKVRIFGDYLKQQAQSLDSTSLDYIDRMQKSTNHMQELITDLLNLSRITRKGKPFAKTNLSTVLVSVLDDLHARIQETQGQVVVEGSESVDADADQMHLLFQNLVDNALKFRQDSTRPLVQVSFRNLDGHTCEIRIQDNGIGFKSTYKDRIFVMFERLHGEKYEGTGIGLAICKRIVERHGGQITAESQEHQGATFIVHLPIDQQS